MYDSNNLECIQINHSIYQVRQNSLSRIYYIAGKIEQFYMYKPDLTELLREKFGGEFGSAIYWFDVIGLSTCKMRSTLTFAEMQQQRLCVGKIN